MSEVGQVIEKRDNNKLLIRLERQEACAKCRACSAGMRSEEMLLEAENLCDAGVGDNVTVSLEESDFMRAVFIMYGIPFVSFMLGIVASYYLFMELGLTHYEIISFLVGLALVAITYFVIHSFEPKFKNDNYVPKATEIVEK